MQPEQGILTTCDRPHFTKCDRCVLNLLRPHLAQAEENKLEDSQIQQLLLQFKQALDHGGVIRLGIDGQVQFMTQRAEHHWFKHQIAQLTSDVPSPCLSLQMEQAGRQMIVRLMPDPIRGHRVIAP